MSNRSQECKIVTDLERYVIMTHYFCEVVKGKNIWEYHVAVWDREKEKHSYTRKYPETQQTEAIQEHLGIVNDLKRQINVLS